MGLREQLSLTQNGGVYYEGTRVTPTNDPVLFVGLGGTGIDALLRIKNEVQTRMPLPKGPNGQILGHSPANIAFLAVDTDKETLKKTFGVAGFDKTGDEFVSLGVDGLPMVVQSVVDKKLNDEEWKWYDKELTAAGGLDGANGVRQVGRFMLFQRINDIRERFERAIVKVLEAAKASNSTSLKIFVLSGIGGGTGSGTFLDVAYILRHIAKEKTPNVELHGYLFTPDLNKGNGGDTPSMYRNGFASLKELDYWMSTGEHGKPYVQKYNSSFTVNLRNPVFDFCHLISATDAEHRLVDYPTAMNAVSGNLFAYITSERVSADGNTAAKSMYNNIAAHVLNARKEHAANYNYLSIGSSKIEIPYTEITTLVAARLFSKMAPVFQQEPERDKFNADLHRLELTADHLWGYIHKDVMVDPIQGKKFGYGDIWPSNSPYQRAEQWLVHAQQVMRQNRSNLTSVREGAFREYINTVIKDMDKGPCYAARLLQSNTSFCLINTLEGFKNDCAERMSACSSRASGLKNRLMQSFSAGNNAGILGRSNAAKDYTEALTEWLANEYNYWAYAELIDGLGDLIVRLRKYYDRVFKNLLDSLCVLPSIFEENVQKIAVDEQTALKDAGKASRYLIRPMEFERKYKGTLDKQMDKGAAAFLSTIANNLKQWVGIELDDVDSDIMENTDIGGCIAKFINENFGDTITMNIETLLLDRAPAGTNSEEYLRETMDTLKYNSVTLFHIGVERKTELDLKSFSMISVPNDCPKIFAVANRGDKPSEESPKFSSERSRLQWVKIMAGMPLYAFPEIDKMEAEYESAMVTSKDTRKGVHLRWEWREELPSPMPEAAWSEEVRNTPQKVFSKEYNARIRKAFDTCVAANIIRPAANGGSAMLYIADESILNNLDLRGSIQEKKARLDMVRTALWSNEATAIKMDPAGTTSNGLMASVRENILRFYNVTQEIEKQLTILEKFESLTAGFENVSYYINSLFANLVYDQGFEVKFRRSALDYSPVTLFDKMSQSTYPDYDTFMGFSKIVNQEVKENINAQFDIARRELIGADGNFNAELVATKIDPLQKAKARYSESLLSLQQRIQQTPLDQRGALLEISDFYEKAIEIINNTLRVFGV